MYLFITEWKKIWKKNLGILFLVVTVITSAAFFILTYQQSNPSQTFYESMVMMDEEDAGSPNRWTENYFREDGNYDKQDEEMLMDMSGAINDPIRYMSLGIMNTNIGIEPHPQTGANWHVQMNTLTLNTVQLSYLRKNQIEPRQPLRIQQSQLDRDRVYRLSENLMGEDKEQATLYADYHESRFDKGWYVIWQLIMDQAHLIILSLIVLIFGGILALEQTKKLTHINLLRVEGVKKPLSYLVKLIVSWASGALFLLTSAGTILLTSLFFIGTGTLKYPVMFHFYEEESHLLSMPDYFLHPHVNETGSAFSLTSISLGHYLFQVTVLILLVLLFLLAVCFAVSLLIKSELVVGLSGLAVIGLHFFLPVHPHNPISYFSVHQIVSGEIRLIHENNTLSFERGVVVLLFWSILLITLGCIMYSMNWQKLKVRRNPA